MELLLLNFEEVARLIGFSPATIENWAYGRKPAPIGFPEPHKIGRLLKYRRADIERWVDGLGAPLNCADSRHSVSDPVENTTRRTRGRPSLRESRLVP
jgi:predicted DNA-binding transcriptional regulator AlpA